MKYIKKFEVSLPRMFEPPKKHEPKHKYDCEHCKFNWSCGFSCSSESLYGSTEKYNI